MEPPPFQVTLLSISLFEGGGPMLVVFAVQITNRNRSNFKLQAEIAERQGSRNQNRLLIFKNLLTSLFLMGCFPGDLQEGKQPIKVFREMPH